MSAGGFVGAAYQSDDGVVMEITIQPETAALSNGTLVNELTSTLVPDTTYPTVTVGGGRNGRGRFYARTIIIRPQPANDVPAGYQQGGRLRVPIVSKVLFDGITRTTNIDYLGKNYRLVGKTAEKRT